MATPKEALVGATQNININSNAKASPSNQSIGNTDGVTFNNSDQNDSATVSFLAKGTNEFSYQGSPIGSFSIAPGSSFGPLVPVTPNVTVDYNVNVGQNSGGAFSIQIGTGPLQIDIINSSGGTDLLNGAIPNNGTVVFNNENANGTAYVTFAPNDVLYDQNNNPVSEQVIQPSTLGAPLTGKGTNKNVSYWVNVITPVKSHRVETGNGSIKVGSN